MKILARMEIRLLYLAHDVTDIYITLKTEKYTSFATLQEAFTWPDDTLHQKQVLMYFETWKTHSVHF